jgi:hypothetical protein
MVPAKVRDRSGGVGGAPPLRSFAGRHRSPLCPTFQHPAPPFRPIDVNSRPSRVAFRIPQRIPASGTAASLGPDGARGARHVAASREPRRAGRGVLGCVVWASRPRRRHATASARRSPATSRNSTWSVSGSVRLRPCTTAPAGRLKHLGVPGPHNPSIVPWDTAATRRAIRSPRPLSPIWGVFSGSAPHRHGRGRGTATRDPSAPQACLTRP